MVTIGLIQDMKYTLWNGRSQAVQTISDTKSDTNSVSKLIMRQSNIMESLSGSIGFKQQRDDARSTMTAARRFLKIRDNSKDKSKIKASTV